MDIQQRRVEGVELAAHVECLRSFDCDYLQGYFFHAPMPIAEFTAWVADQRRITVATSAA